VRSVAFTTDGHILTSGRDHLVRLWDINGNPVKQLDPLNDIAMQAAFAGGKIIAADWSGAVRVWKPDGTRVGDLDSNPPTIAQRIDALNKRLADLNAVAAKRQDACARADAALAAARKQAAEAQAALEAKKSALAAAQSRLGVLRKQCADAPAAIQKAQQESTRLSLLSSEIACASAANPLLSPASSAALASRALAGQALAAQKARLAQSQAALAATRIQCAAFPGDIRARAASGAALTAAVRSAAEALSAATFARDNTAAQINAARLGLAKWQAAAARLPPNPQYASRKTDAK
jgi:chromosome segregation ATPase